VATPLQKTASSPPPIINDRVGIQLPSHLAPLTGSAVKQELKQEHTDIDVKRKSFGKKENHS